MRLLLDTNVVLDALLERDPWHEDADRIWAAHVAGEIFCHVSSNSVTDVFYVTRREFDADLARDAVIACVDQLFVISVGAWELRNALALGGSDFEDDLQIACAAAANLDGIVTRDRAGFAGAAIPVFEPAEIVAKLN
jgi:predicted nucleic acid-binding protein